MNRVSTENKIHSRREEEAAAAVEIDLYCCLLRLSRLGFETYYYSLPFPLEILRLYTHTPRHISPFSSSLCCVYAFLLL